MLDIIWLNLVELSKLEPFSELLDKVAEHMCHKICHPLQVVSKEKDWKYWCDTETPEEEDIPSGLEKGLTIFRKLLLIRSWCPDRTLSQARKYIADALGVEFLETKVSFL